MLTLSKTSDESGKNVETRIGLLLAFAFFTGLGLGPMLGFVININPEIIYNAYMFTNQIALGFSICSLMSPRSIHLILGGPLLSLLLLLTNVLLTNYFSGSVMIYEFYHYVGFAAICGFVLFETHLINEKRRLGDKDYLSHSLDLLFVFVDISRFLVSILAKKKEDDKDRKKRNE